jgi:hypothetical protein
MTHERRVPENDQERAGRVPASEYEPCLCKCCSSGAIRQLIRREIQADRARAAVEEAEQWESCFGEKSPPDRKAKQRRISQVASGRAFLALLNKPKSQPPSFDDFFFDHTPPKKRGKP